MGAYRVYNSDFVHATWSGSVSRKACRFPSISRLPAVNPMEASKRQGFFFIGRWIENKGIEPLIEAYQQSKIDKIKHPLILAGKGPLVEKILSQIEKGDTEGIRYLGFLTDEEKFEWYCKVKWNVAAPNTQEDMGLTPIEARHCKTPSIITRDGGLPEAAGKSAIICIPGSVISLKESIELAAGMNENDYRDRAELAHSTLKGYLKDYSFFDPKYRTFSRDSIAV
jgi:glycosyltransferase involved in cell wall biosynthesis